MGCGCGKALSPQIDIAVHQEPPLLVSKPASSTQVSSSHPNKKEAASCDTVEHQPADQIQMTNENEAKSLVEAGGDSTAAASLTASVGEEGAEAQPSQHSATGARGTSDMIVTQQLSTISVLEDNRTTLKRGKTLDPKTMESPSPDAQAAAAGSTQAVGYLVKVMRADMEAQSPGYLVRVIEGASSSAAMQQPVHCEGVGPTPSAVLCASDADRPHGQQQQTREYVFGMGCFWGADEAMREVVGPGDTVCVGYSGGTIPNPEHKLVSKGKSGHIEAVCVTLCPTSAITYTQLLGAFFSGHDPAAFKAKAQYRSTIFAQSGTPEHDAAVRELAAFAKARTVIVPTSAFYRAEEKHQGYIRKQGAGGSCSMQMGNGRGLVHTKNANVAA